MPVKSRIKRGVTREDAIRLLQMTENGEEQVGGEIVFE